MNGLLRTISELLDVARGRLPDRLGPAERSRLVTAAGLCSLVFAALWGVAAGSTDALLAGTNALKVPMIVLFSALTALPAGLLAQRLSGSTERAGDLVLGFAGAVFSGTLVAAVTAPIVAIYLGTSQWAGPYLGMGSVFLSIGVAALMFFKSALKNVGKESHTSNLVPRIVLALVTLAVLPQLIALASPILQASTVWDAGVDVVTVAG